MRLPWTFSTFDYPALCELLFEQCDATFETATVEGRAEANGTDAIGVKTDRGGVGAPLVDALGWRRVLSTTSTSRPTHRSRGGSRCIRPATATTSRSGSSGVIPAGYGWSFPAADEVRVGSGRSIRVATSSGRRSSSRSGSTTQRAIPGQLDPASPPNATANGVFFVGDSAGHCLPLTAEGIRTAFYFGIACGRELREVLEGRADRDAALRRYSGSQPATAEVRVDAAGAAARAQGPRGCSPSACVACAPTPSCAGLSGTTSRSRTRVRTLARSAAARAAAPSCRLIEVDLGAPRQRPLVVVARAPVSTVEQQD